MNFPKIQDLEGEVSLLIIAGEHSGDQHAARMVNGLKDRHPGCAGRKRIAALGGPALKETDVEFLHDMMDHAVVGAVEVLKHYPFFRRLFAEMLRWILKNRPKVICLIDYPGFNLRLASKIRKLTRKGEYQPRIVYYISPQLWAWKSKRRFAMARDLDSLALIFPFEKEVYRDTTLETIYVGHPFVSTDVKSPLYHDPQAPLLLLPGSREGPIRRIFPILVQTYLLLKKSFPDLRVRVLSAQCSLTRILYEIWKEQGGKEADIEVVQAQKGPYGGSAVLMSSGTMSLHCALAGIPGAIVYRANPVTFWIGKHLVRIPWLGMANILLGRTVWREYLQGEAQPKQLAEKIKILMSDKETTLPFQKAAEELVQLLQPGEEGDVVDWIFSQLTFSE